MTGPNPLGDLTVEHVHVAKLATYHRNPRRGNVSRIRESLRTSRALT